MAHKHTWTKFCGNIYWIYSFWKQICLKMNESHTDFVTRPTFSIHSKSKKLIFPTTNLCLFYCLVFIINWQLVIEMQRLSKFGVQKALSFVQRTLILMREKCGLEYKSKTKAARIRFSYIPSTFHSSSFCIRLIGNVCECVEQKI